MHLVRELPNTMRCTQMPTHKHFGLFLQHQQNSSGVRNISSGSQVILAKKITDGLQVLNWCFCRTRLMRQKWSYFRIERSSRLLQHGRKRILCLTKSHSIIFSFPFREENTGNSVSIHYIFSFHLLFYLFHDLLLSSFTFNTFKIKFSF